MSHDGDRLTVMWRQSERDKEKNGVKENNKNGQSEEIKAKRGKEKKKDKRTFSIHRETKDLHREKKLTEFF